VLNAYEFDVIVVVFFTSIVGITGFTSIVVGTIGLCVHSKSMGPNMDSSDTSDEMVLFFLCGLNIEFLCDDSDFGRGVCIKNIKGSYLWVFLHLTETPPTPHANTKNTKERDHYCTYPYEYLY
jgi:hypothetical protein